jgi:hypothetical protein
LTDRNSGRASTRPGQQTFLLFGEELPDHGGHRVGVLDVQMVAAGQGDLAEVWHGCDAARVVVLDECGPAGLDQQRRCGDRPDAGEDLLLGERADRRVLQPGVVAPRVAARDLRQVTFDEFVRGGGEDVG